jgi:hypothetical protein
MVANLQAENASRRERKTKFRDSERKEALNPFLSAERTYLSSSLWLINKG